MKIMLEKLKASQNLSDVMSFTMKYFMSSSRAGRQTNVRNIRYHMTDFSLLPVFHKGFYKC